MKSILHLVCPVPFPKRHDPPGIRVILLHLAAIPLLICMLLSISHPSALAQSAGGIVTRATPTGTSSPGGVGYVKVDIANFRSAPTTASKIIGKLKRGDRVALVEKKGDWYRVVATGLRAGWVHGMLIRMAVSDPEPKSIEPEKAVPHTAVLIVPVGRVRAQPSLDSPIIFRLQEGNTATIIAVEDEWNHIRLSDGRTGWSHQSLFQKDMLPPPTGLKQIRSVHARLISDEEETVVFELNGYFAPETFVVPGEKPKVVCDFSGVFLGEKVGRLIQVDGKLIQQITIEPNRRGKANVRVILALMPENNYKIQPVFYKQDNLYSLIVRPRK